MEHQGSQPHRGLAALVRNKWTQRIVYLLIIPALLLYALWLPPASLGARLFHTDYPVITPDGGGTVPGPEGARLEVPAGAVAKRLRLRLDALTADDVAALKPDRPEAIAAQALPADVTLHGPLYRIDALGDAPSAATVTLPVPYDLSNLALAELYGWDGSQWQWLPAQVQPGGTEIAAQVDTLPAMFVVAEAQPSDPRIAFGTSIFEGEGQLATADAPVILHGVQIDEEGLPGGPYTGDGTAEAELTSHALGKMLSISNVVDGVARSDWVENIISDATTRKAHIDAIVALASGWASALPDARGIEIAYDGVSAVAREAMTAFVQELAAALHAAGQQLAVRIDPAAVGTSDSGYDLRAIGAAADVVRVAAPSDPAAYADGTIDHLLTQLTAAVDRRKLELVIDTYARRGTGDGSEALTYRAALSLLTQEITADRAGTPVLPGQAVKVSLPDLATTPITVDPASKVYSFVIAADGAPETVYLETAASVAAKLAHASRYGLGGAVIEGALDPENDRNVAAMARNYRPDLAVPEPTFALVWTVEDASSKRLAQQVVPLTDPNYTWTAPSAPGNYVISASVSDDGGETDIGGDGKLAMVVPTLTPTPTMPPTPTPTNTPTPAPTNTPEPTSEAPAEPPATEGEGEAAPPAPTEAPPAPPPASHPQAPSSFGYGIQVHMVDQGNHGQILDAVQGIGFGWIKQQVEWFRFNPAPGQYHWGSLDAVADAAAARGIKVLFSVVKAPQWARPGHTDFGVEGPPADPQTYADFIGAMAAHFKGRVQAYEIWNEQNLHYEWGNEPIDAGRYMELLKRAYGAVKAADPNAIVVSGALTPTGAPPPWAVDDFGYLRQMYAHGLRNYCDAVGAHPSGYNVPPNAPWPGYNDPTAGFRGPFDGGSAGHHSWAFQSTMSGYRAIMNQNGDANKPIWVTEFGWASVENLGVGPAAGYEYAADNSEGEQAQFIVEAYQRARAGHFGRVGPMFLWNLNFAPVAGNAWEGSAFGIVRGDWSQRPAYAALRDMPK